MRYSSTGEIRTAIRDWHFARAYPALQNLPALNHYLANKLSTPPSKRANDP